MDRGTQAEALLIEVSRWQRAEAQRLGFPLLFRGEPAARRLSEAQGLTEKEMHHEAR